MCVPLVYTWGDVQIVRQKENLTVRMLRDLCLVWEFLAHVTADPAIFPLLG